MAFDFPSSPTEGQIFNAPSGPTYVFNSPVWKAVGQGQIAIVSDTPPANPANGTLWYESDTGLLFISYNDGNSTQWVQVGGVTTVIPTTAEAMNRVVNPCFQINQENAGANSGNSAGMVFYSADQWMVAWSVATGTAATGRYAGISFNGSPYYIALFTTVGATVTGSSYASINHKIEGIRVADLQWGTGVARQVVVRFWASHPTGGTFTFGIQNSAGDRSYLAPYTLPAAVVTMITIVVPGDMTGTWLKDTGVGLVMQWQLGTGSTYTGVAGWQAGNKNNIAGSTNGLAAANGGINLFDVGLYADPQNTGVAPPWQMPDEAEELRACQRYWQQGAVGMSGNVTSGNNHRAFGSIPVTPRVTSIALAGTNAGAGSFPATVGALTYLTSTNIYEIRTANATAAGFFLTTVIANARM